MMELKNIRGVLKQSAQLLQDNLVDGIINEGLLGRTGRLASGVRVEYKDDKEAPSYAITMESYGYYQDSGVKGTKGWRFSPNPESLFSPGQFTSKVIGGNLPFPVRKSIAEKGFRPRPFIQPAVGRTIQLLQRPLTQAGAEDIGVEMIKSFKKNGAIVK